MPVLTREPRVTAQYRWLCCAMIASGCESKLVVGTWACPLTEDNIAAAGQTGNVAGGGAGSIEALKTIPVDWSTGFEDGFCDYYIAGGNCYSHPKNTVSAIFETVDGQEQVHTGRHAAAFTVEAGQDVHTRCYLEGKLPKQATYGAWYYIPLLAQTSGNWNLLHFQVHRQSNPAGVLDNLWDISVENNAAGGLRLRVWGPTALGKVQAQFPSIPIGKWFHIEMFLKLAADETGEIAVYQDGTRYASASGIVTDYSDSDWGQWYVGNLAEDLEPPRSTVYVDDVSVKATRGP